MKKIEINTTQNVVIEYELASILDRIIAYIIDLTFISILVGLVFFMFGLSTDIGFDSDATEMIGMIFALLIIAGYHLFFELMMQGQSPGKKIIGIQVVKIQRNKLNFYDLTMRASLRMVDLTLSLGSMAVLFCMSSRKGQRIGDILADTTVIKVTKDNVYSLNRLKKLQTLENYQPQYPLLKNFNDTDMLTIKECLFRYKNHPNQAHKDAVMEICRKMKDLLQLEEMPSNKIQF